ncbi:invasion associated locus B family protein [Agrobacterium tumefaciens]|uniref:invasion associated locus B family protein n=1 Tax=Agrobacterium tumefaciens TaxID=358 RepID=UPI000551252A|nr:invasion associated locus B family protein [Agrobacterium tumefaciens]
MLRRAVTTARMIAACLLLSGSPPAVGQEILPAGPGFHVKPSEVNVPEGVPLGQYRRTTTPFGSWTLVCDENRQTKQMICNVSQVIVDLAGNMVFSWSLAATKDGKPFMVLRTSPLATNAGKISLKFPGRDSPIEIAMDGCNEVVCVAKVPVGPVLREHIGKGSSPQISYSVASGKSISVTASLKGLATALSAIN